MPYDALAMAAAGDDIRSATAGGRIQKVLQPAATAVGLSIYHGGQHWLVLSADARHARAALSRERLAKAFSEPSPFVMLLRKHLDGARLIAIEQRPYERVLILRAAGERSVQLVVEIMGKHSNVILVSGEDRILGALKLVRPHESRVRPILPGRPFQLPPERLRDPKMFPDGPRIDPFLEPALCADVLAAAPPHLTVQEALLGLLPGCSPFLADQIAARARYSASSELQDVSIQEIVRAGGELYSLYRTRAWEPYVFRNRRGHFDFAPYSALGVTELQPAVTISEAIETCLGASENRDVLRAERSALLAQIDRRRSQVKRRLASLSEGLEAAGQAEEAMQRGQLILAYGHLIEPPATELHIPELDVTIPLDSRLSVSENAERTFRRYRKLRDAGRKIPVLLADGARELDRLEDIASFARLATTDAELRELRDQLVPEPAAPSRKSGRKRGPLRYGADGVTVLAGRNARENEDVTFRLAQRDDLWLHARERTGAHVILQRNGRSLSEQSIEAAARLAAFLSEGREDSAVDVAVTEVRHVRKVPGGAPGRVTYRNERTLRVRPSMEGWRASP